jgi:CBS domain-containing protein
MLKLSEIMTAPVVSATPEMTLREAMALLSDRHISGAPVVSGGKVVGVFSSTDLLLYIAELDAAQPSVSFRRRQTPLEELTVSEVMTRDVKSLAPACPADLAAAFMQRARIHRVLVMEGDRLLGIVTTTDLAGAIAEHRVGARVRSSLLDPIARTSDC